MIQEKRVQKQKIEFRSADDRYLLSAYYYPPENTPKAALLVVHGLNEHQERYLPLVKFMQQNQVAVLTYDQRGHGQSSGIRNYVDRFDDLVEDVFVAGQQLQQKMSSKKEDKKIPLILFGHSMGGQVAVNAAAKKEAKIFSGLVMSSANIRVGWPVSKFKIKAGFFLEPYLPKLKLLNEVKPQWISTLSHVVKDYMNDPFVKKFITLRLAREILENQKSIFEKAEHIKVPVLVLHGDADKICAASGSKDFFKHLVVRDKTLKIYEGAYHEILNDFCQDDVLDDILNWIKNKL